MGGACNTYGRKEGCIQGLVGNPKGKRKFRRPTHRWEGNIKMGLQEVGFGDMYSTDLAQDTDGGLL